MIFLQMKAQKQHLDWFVRKLPLYLGSEEKQETH